MRATLVLLIALLVAPLELVAQQVYEVGRGVSAPILVAQRKPAYTPEAQAAGVVGWVHVEFVVLPTGAVSDVKIVDSCPGTVGTHRELNGDPFHCATVEERAKGVDPINRALDQQAVNAIKQWRFEPGLRAGKPVAVRITTKLEFRPSAPK